MKCVDCGEREQDPLPVNEGSGLCGVCIWRRWLSEATDGFWDNVECIECELDRDCDKHPGQEASHVE
jgi:hypothetical protein